MKIAIVGALDSELFLLSEALENKTEEPLGEGVLVHGTLGAHEVTLVKLSIGKVNAASKTQAVIDRVSPELVINTGIAGSLDKEVGVLDTVLSESALYHDFDAKILENYYPFRSQFDADEEALQVAKKTALDERYRHHIGMIATGDLFVQDSAKKDAIASETGALCVEMEGAAVAHTAYMNGVRFLIIRTISDHADDEADLDYETFEKKAADQSARFVQHLLENL